MLGPCHFFRGPKPHQLLDFDQSSIAALREQLSELTDDLEVAQGQARSATGQAREHSAAQERLRAQLMAKDRNVQVSWAQMGCSNNRLSRQLMVWQPSCQGKIQAAG